MCHASKAVTSQDYLQAMAVPYYCEAFYVEPGQCWRMVFAQDGTGHPTHCPEPVVWRSRFKDGSEKWHPRVDSCDGHADDLAVARRIP
jgi:hypothetical protein